MSLRDEILALDDLRSEKIIVPQWGGREVLIKQLSAKRFMDISKPAANGGEQEQEEFLARIVAESVCDPKTGKPIFLPEDVPALMEKSLEVLRLIGDKATELNGLIKTEEDLRKN
ncbi:MAG: hypothetical protein WC455_14545 [Dehalococcoidia bacterium]|jgi:hypothetical protein